MGRVDLAEKELKTMQKMDDDATITLLASCWINLFLGTLEKIQEAISTFQEIIDKFGSTSILLNGQAICQMKLKKFEEAEKLLLEAMEKNNKDPDTLINLIVCSHYLKKSDDIIQRYLK